MVRAIIFDLDDTLLDFKKSERVAIARTLDNMGVSYTDATLDRYHQINKACWTMLERGEITRAELLPHRFALLYSEIGFAGDPDATQKIYEENLSAEHDLIPGATELLAEMKGKYTLLLASNGSTRIQERRIKESGVGEFFSHIFISESIGSKKPDKEYFDYIFNTVGNIKREEAIIVGDSPGSDILGGINAGIITCLYNPDAKPTAGSVKPHYEITRLSELLTLIEKINEKDN